MLQSIVASLRGYQMACLSEFIVIQQKLIQIGRISKLIWWSDMKILFLVSVSISSLQINGLEFDSSGSVIAFTPLVIDSKERYEKYHLIN